MLACSRTSRTATTSRRRTRDSAVEALWRDVAEGRKDLTEGGGIGAGEALKRDEGYANRRREKSMRGQ